MIKNDCNPTIESILEELEETFLREFRGEFVAISRLKFPKHPLVIDERKIDRPIKGMISKCGIVGKIPL